MVLPYIQAQKKKKKKKQMFWCIFWNIVFTEYFFHIYGKIIDVHNDIIVHVVPKASWIIKEKLVTLSIF